MLLVKTKIGLSQINGIGIFADQLIPKGVVIWKFGPGFDLSIEQSEIARLDDPAKEQFLKYAYLNSRTREYVLCWDDARFFNHSEDPNTGDIPSPDDREGLTIALRDIQPGEELTCDYKEFDADFDNKMRKTT